MGQLRPFSCLVEPDRSLVRIRPVGELDIATVPEVQERLAEVRGTGFDHLVLDLRNVEFVDSTGLRLMVRWAEASEAEGFRFELARATRPVRRAVEVTGLGQRLPFVL